MRNVKIARVHGSSLTITETVVYQGFVVFQYGQFMSNCAMPVKK